MGKRKQLAVAGAGHVPSQTPTQEGWRAGGVSSAMDLSQKIAQLMSLPILTADSSM
jgi:hypothetical protein